VRWIFALLDVQKLGPSGPGELIEASGTTPLVTGLRQVAPQVS